MDNKKQLLQITLSERHINSLNIIKKDHPEWSLQDCFNLLLDTGSAIYLNMLSLDEEDDDEEYIQPSGQPSINKFSLN